MIWRLMNPFKMTKWLLIVLALFLVWQAAVFLAPAPREYSAAERAALDETCRRAAEEIARGWTGPATGTVVRVGVAHLVGDPEEVITPLLKARLAERPGFEVRDGSVLRNFLEDVSRAVAEATSMEEIAFAGRRVDLDLVVAGRVVDAVETPEGARASLAIYARDARNGRWLMRETVGAEWTSGQARERESARRATALRLVLWAAFALALPWATPFATRRAVRARSNRGSALLLGAYLAVDALAGLWAIHWTLNGPGQALAALAALLLAAAYNTLVCERIARELQGR
jgi:hypothetical protein